MQPSPFSLLLLLTLTCLCFKAAAGPTTTDTTDTTVAGQPFPYVAPLLTTNNGTKVSTAAVWESVRRPEVAASIQEAVVGTLPPPSALLSAAVVNSTTTRFATLYYVHATYNTSAGGVMDAVGIDLEIMVPKGSGAGSPLFMTQWNHRNWALMGVSRGYVSVVYPGADTRDAAPAFQAAFPRYTMALIVARAYVASLSLDFLLSGDAGAPVFNASQVAVTGHSRNGKQSLLFAAFDHRVTAVVGSSPGAPIDSPYGFSSHNFYGEGPDAGQAGHWWLHSILNYTAAPQTLPMDGHGVLAMIAPRHCAVSVAWNDMAGSLTFAMERVHVLVSQVYDLYDARENYRTIHRPGTHHGHDEPSHYFDFFDSAFGRLTPGFALSWSSESSPGTVPSSPPFAQRYLTPAGFSWVAWNASAHPVPSPPPLSAPLLERVEWVTQTGAASMPSVRGVGSSYCESGGHGAWSTVMMNRALDGAGGIAQQALSFGDYVSTNVFYPAASAGSKAPHPAIVWLHPYAYTTGYTAVYGSANVWEELAGVGFVTLPFDLIGMGTRLREGGTNFYARYGTENSLFGAMLRDVRAAVDFLMCRTAANRTTPACNTGETFTATYVNTLDDIPAVDPSRIYVAGYALGGNLALHAAALDARLAGAASFAGFTPYRTDTQDRPTFGLRRLSEFHALLPRLGLFVDDPAGVPYDYDELIASLAPRPTLLYTPTQDRDATYGDVEATVAKAAPAWGGKGFNHTAPATYTKMDVEETAALLGWAVAAAGL